MKNLEALKREQVRTETQEVFDTLKKKVGFVPNIYATTANSHKALTGLLNLDNTLRGGAFNGKEIEAIALAVAETNNCGYCLAAHTAVGKLQGFSEDETVGIRTGEVEDKKLKALTDLSKAITETRGFPEQQLIDKFFEAGYNKAALAELIGWIAVNTITNYTNHIAGTEIDFPKAPALATA
jgi:AhpD family alkylhydroperoxidase